MRLKDISINKSKNIGFVVGAGPSLYNQNLDCLKNYITITVNSGILKVPFADLYLSDDIGCSSWSYYIKDLPKLPCLKLLYKTKLKNNYKYFKKDEVIFFFHKSYYVPSEKKYYPEGLVLTKDEPIIGSRTSFSSSLHVLYILGVKNVILLGNDCQLSKDGKRYFFEYWPKEKQPYRISGQPFNEKNKLMGFSSKDFIFYWKNFAAVNTELLNSGEFNVINCSDTPSDFNFFPKMTIDNVLDKFK
jgi:hypothetical protein